MTGNIVAVLVFLLVLGVLVFGVEVNSLASAWEAVKAGFGGLVEVFDA